MGSFAGPLKTLMPDLNATAGKITGTGASTPTVNAGMDFDGGPVIARTGVGAYSLTFAPGTREVYGFGSFWADTAGAVQGWTAVFGQYNATTRVMTMAVFNETVVDTPAELAAATGMYLLFLVRGTTLRGGK